MALVAVTAGNQAKASDVQQVIDLLKGVMTDQTIGIGVANRSQSGIYQGQNITATGGVATLFEQAGTLTAAANSDLLVANKIAATVIASGTFTGLTAAGLRVDASGFTKTGTGTIATAYGLHVLAPTIGSTNWAAMFSGHVGFAGSSPTLSSIVAQVTSSSVSGSDNRPIVSLTVGGTAPGAGATLCQLSFANAFPATPCIGAIGNMGNHASYADTAGAGTTGTGIINAAAAGGGLGINSTWLLHIPVLG